MLLFWVLRRSVCRFLEKIYVTQRPRGGYPAHLDTSVPSLLVFINAPTVHSSSRTRRDQPARNASITRILINPGKPQNLVAPSIHPVPFMHCHFSIDVTVGHWSRSLCCKDHSRISPSSGSSSSANGAGGVACATGVTAGAGNRGAA